MVASSSAASAGLAPVYQAVPRRASGGGHAGHAGGGFTLIELLVAVTITLLLVVLLARVFTGATNSWRHSEAQIDAYREARGALLTMAHDLGATLSPSYSQAGGGVIQTTPSPLVPTLVLERNSAGPTETGGPVNEEVYCLTNVANAGASNLSAIGYYCEWLPDFLPLPADGVDRRPRAYALLRQTLDSNGTFQHLHAGVAGEGSSPLTFSDLFSRTGSPAPAPSVTQLAAYIWDLRFRIDTDLNDNPSTGIPDGNSPPPQDHSQPARRYGADAQYQPYPPQLPAYVEIRFRALSDLAARRLEGNTSVTPATWADLSSGFTPSPIYQQVIATNYQQFVLRVPLLNATPPTPTPTPGQ